MVPERLSLPVPCPKGKSRLETRMDAKPLTKVTDKQFKAGVWRRDRNRCRCCGRKVERMMDRLPERGEVHHLYGRLGDLRFEVKGAILTCLRCHERLTGRVNEKWVVIPLLEKASRFIANETVYIDAASDLSFQRAA